MATIPQPHLFCRHSVDRRGDLERLELVLDALPDEALMQLLEAGRQHGLSGAPDVGLADRPLRVPASSIAALRRELLRNG